jgi:hypothetical protein
VSPFYKLKKAEALFQILKKIRFKRWAKKYGLKPIQFTKVASKVWRKGFKLDLKDVH